MYPKDAKKQKTKMLNPEVSYTSFLLICLDLIYVSSSVLFLNNMSLICYMCYLCWTLFATFIILHIK